MPGFCEEQQVYAHARDPYKRVDILPSSRHVRIELAGVTIADTHSSLLLLETGLPTRYSIPLRDVRTEFLTPTECTPITQYLCLYNERVDAISVDDELMAVPTTIWSE